MVAMLGRPWLGGRLDRNETVLVGPDGPDAGYGRGGVDEDAVEIEEQSAAVNFHLL